jgi:hypothetical protein
MNDRIGKRVERVDVRNGEREIRYSLVCVWYIEGDMGIGDLRDDHDGRPSPIDRPRAQHLSIIAIASSRLGSGGMSASVESISRCCAQGSTNSRG